ncbi:MAG: hypothetical protein HY062_02985 [Bacteroidetes bacterium]|nr:hypothetical protein [Bacteroidota bacterium]
MKTFMYLPTLLALIIQVMVSGQTQGNQARKIRVDIMGPKQPIRMNYSNSNITMSMTEYNQLLEQAHQLKIETAKLKEQVASIEYASLVKQIEVSEMSAHISLQKFEHNKGIILQVFPKIPKNTITFSKAQNSYSESERFMKLAKEMREEARAQSLLEARLGNMSNAEEKEMLALDKQEEVLKLFGTQYTQLLEQVKTVVEVQNETGLLKMNQIVVADKEQALPALLAEQMKQAENLKVTAQQLRVQAEAVSPNQKHILMNEAMSLEEDYLTKQLEVSALRSKINYDKFCENRVLIASLINDAKHSELLMTKAMQLNNEAEYLMKMGKELREEANAQLTNAAKYGATTNAEEKETVALQKQTESISVIEAQHSKLVVANKF